MKHLILFTFCLLPTLLLKAQLSEEEIEQLATHQNTLSDTTISLAERAEQHYRIALLYKQNDTEKTIHHAQQSLHFAKQTEGKKGVATVLLFLGKVQLRNGLMTEAKANLQELRALPPQNRDVTTYLDATNTLGFLHLRLKEYNPAENLLTEVVELADSIGDQNSLMNARGNLSILYGYQGKVEKKIETLLSMLDGEQLSPYQESGVYYSIAQEYLELPDYGKLEHYAKKAIEVAKANNFSDIVGYNGLLLGEAFLRQEKYDSAKVYLLLAADLENAVISGNGLIELGNLALKQDKLEEALTYYRNAVEKTANLEDIGLRQSLAILGINLAVRQNDDQEVLRIYDEELQQYDGIDIRSNSEVSLYQSILEIKAKYGKSISLDEFKTFTQAKDSLLGVARTERVAEITEKYENQKLIAENAVSQQQLLEQRLWTGSIAGSLLLALVSLGIVNRSRRKSKQRAAVLAEKNDKITAYSKEIEELRRSHGHDTINQFSDLIFDLQFQQEKLADKGDDPLVLMSIEQQLINYRIAQQMIREQPKGSLYLDDYLHQFTQSIVEARRIGGTPIDLKLECPRFEVKAQLATRVGSILNELLTNSVKYAVRINNTLPIQLTVKLLENDRFSIHFIDAGIPSKNSSDQTVFSSKSGIGLVKGITRRAGGNIIHYAEDSFDYLATFNR